MRRSRETTGDVADGLRTSIATAAILTTRLICQLSRTQYETADSALTSLAARLNKNLEASWG